MTVGVTPIHGAHVADEDRDNRLAMRLRRFFTSERLNSTRFLILFWVGARVLVFAIWLIFFPSTQGDVLYYFNRVDGLFQVGPEQTLQEYPTPVIWFLSLPWVLGLGTAVGYVAVFVVIVLGVDAAFTALLWHTGGRMRGQAVVFWTVFLLFVGPTGYLRFDLVTSVLAGGAIISVLRRKPGLAGALAGIGAAIKLWPALLWPALCGGPNRQKLQVSLGFFGMGGALALSSLLWAGWDRLLSPLGWQSDRGLQVESVWATVPMFLRGLGVGDYAVAISRYQAFEIWGTGVRIWMSFADVAFIAGLLATATAYVMWIWRGEGKLMESCALMLLVILVMIVTNKTFSPQYVIWLGGPLAAAFAVMGARNPMTPAYQADRRRMKSFSVLMLAVTLLTTLVYPIGYAPLVRDLGGYLGLLRLPVTLVLVARNVLIVWLFVGVISWVWNFIKPSAFRAVRAHVRLRNARTVAESAT